MRSFLIAALVVLLCGCAGTAVTNYVVDSQGYSHVKSRLLIQSNTSGTASVTWYKTGEIESLVLPPLDNATPTTAAGIADASRFNAVGSMATGPLSVVFPVAAVTHLVNGVK